MSTNGLKKNPRTDVLIPLFKFQSASAAKEGSHHCGPGAIVSHMICEYVLFLSPVIQQERECSSHNAHFCSGMNMSPCEANRKPIKRFPGAHAMRGKEGKVGFHLL